MIDVEIIEWLKDYKSKDIGSNDSYFSMEDHHKELYNKNLKGFVNVLSNLLNNHDYLEINSYFLYKPEVSFYYLYIFIYEAYEMEKKEVNLERFLEELIEFINKDKTIEYIKDSAVFSCAFNACFESNINKHRVFKYYDSLAKFQINKVSSYNDEIFNLLFDEGEKLFVAFVDKAIVEYNKNTSSDFKELVALSYKI